MTLLIAFMLISHFDMHPILYLVSAVVWILHVGYHAEEKAIKIKLK